MAREFSYFYIPATIRGIKGFTFNQASVDTNDIQESTLFVGIRLQNMVLMNQDFYQTIGFLSSEAVEGLIASVIPTPTVLTFSDQSDAMRAGLVKRLNFTMVSTNVGSTVPNPPISMKVYILYPSTYTDTNIGDLVIRFPFNYDGVRYRAVPKSIKIFKSKDTTPTYSGFGPPPQDYPTLSTPLPSQPTQPSPRTE